MKFVYAIVFAMLLTACSREAPKTSSHESASAHTGKTSPEHEGSPSNETPEHTEGPHEQEESHATTIPADVAATAGIATAVVGPGTIAETISLYGAIGADRTRVRDVKARFPGVIREVTRRVGDRVRSGESLATVESNESLRNYTITAPIAGIITQRHAEPGEQADTTTLFEIADFSRVWAELKVFQRDRARLRVGQHVRVITDGAQPGTGVVEYIAPAGERNSQSLTARVVLDNAKAMWSPGQFIEGRVAVTEAPVPLVVPLSAIQTLDDETVVFTQNGAHYAAQKIRIGRRDADQAEVLSGLEAGATIVVANSYLIKADIEKSSASHEH